MSCSVLTRLYSVQCYVVGPAPAGVTEKIYQLSKQLSEYHISPDLIVDIGQIGSQQYTVDGFGEFKVEVIDSVEDYSEFMKEIFDFPAIKTLLTDSKHPFKLLINAMHGGMGSALMTNETVLATVSFQLVSIEKVMLFV